MKMKLVSLIAVAVLLLAGCSFLALEEYEVGASIDSIVGNTVKIKAMLWTYEDSGWISHENWKVTWGDGSVEDESDALVAEHIYMWTHTYVQTGSYLIAVTCGGSSPAIMEAKIE